MLNNDPTQRPPGLTLAAMHRRGVPSSVAFMVEHLMNNRAVHWSSDVSEDDAQRLEGLWKDLQHVKEGEDLVAWGAQMRRLLWNSIEPWSAFAEKTGLEEQEQRWERAKVLIGAPVFRAIKDHDHWRNSWRLAAASDYPKLEREQQDRQALRRRTYPESNVPPEALSLGMVTEMAQNLQIRFGLTRIIGAGSLSLEDTWHHLRLTEQGLSTLAKTLAWSEKDIGGDRLGLTFEMAEDSTAAAHYDAGGRTINVALNGGWGSFAHEWAHALDHALGEKWLPNAYGLNRYATHQSTGNSAHLPDEHALHRTRLRERVSMPKDMATRVQVARRTLAGLPQTLEDLRDGAPSPSWHALAQEQLTNLQTFQGFAFDPLAKPEAVLTRWKAWQNEHGDAWEARAMKEPSSAGWVQEWRTAVQNVDAVAFASLPTLWSWQALGQDRDRVEGSTYWHAPHEEWARSFHAHVRSMVGHDSWIANRADRPDHFPQGVELQRESAWWVENLPKLREDWSLVAEPLVQARLTTVVP